MFTLVIGHVWFDVVFDEYSDDIVAVHFAGVTQGGPSRVVLHIDVCSPLQ